MRLALFDLDNTLLAGRQRLRVGAVSDRERRARSRSLRGAQPTVLRAIQGRHARHPRVSRLPAEAAVAPSARACWTIGTANSCATASCPSSRKRRAIWWTATATMRARSSPRPTASSLAPIAREFGIEHLVATEPEENATASSPAASAAYPVSRGQGDAARSLARGARSELVGSSARPGSIPIRSTICRCSRKVTHPVAVDPDETLKETALEKGWLDHQPAVNRR